MSEAYTGKQIGHKGMSTSPGVWNSLVMNWSADDDGVEISEIKTQPSTRREGQGLSGSPGRGMSVERASRTWEASSAPWGCKKKQGRSA